MKICPGPFHPYEVYFNSKDTERIHANDAVQAQPSTFRSVPFKLIPSWHPATLDT